MMIPTSASAVLDVWFDGCSASELGTGSSRWYRKDDAFDAMLSTRFGEDLDRAGRGELGGWCGAPRGSLALVVLCDQISRNVHRGTARSFAFDPLAVATSLGARARGEDASLTIPERVFLAMPLMHSESLVIHDEATAVFEGILAHAEHAVPTLVPYAKSTIGYEEKHRGILERFGRYPHRNGILGRASTAEEREFLETPGSSF